MIKFVVNKNDMGTAIATLDTRINKYVAQMNAKEKQAVLGIVKTIVEKRSENDFWEDKGVIAEMDRRFKEMEGGKVKLYSLEEAEAHARQSYKTRKRKKQ